jgi:hypothetical protein
MPKRLKALKILEVSAVTAAANPHAAVKITKRMPHDVIDSRTGEVVGEFSNRRKAAKERDRLNAGARSLAEAEAEIAENRRYAKSHAAVTEENMQTEIVDIAKAQSILTQVDKRVDEIARTHFISHQGALMRLAQTSALVNKSDAELWQGYRLAKQLVEDNRPAPIAAPVQVAGPAFAAMAKRVDAIMKADSTVRSRESAIAKVATSVIPSDQALWQAYKLEGQGHDTAPVGKGEVAPGELRNLVFLNLTGAIQASYPGISVEQARSWARKIQQKGPPRAALHQTSGA